MTYFSYPSYGAVCRFLALNSQFGNLRFPMNFFIIAGILTPGIHVYLVLYLDYVFKWKFEKDQEYIYLLLDQKISQFSEFKGTEKTIRSKNEFQKSV